MKSQKITYAINCALCIALALVIGNPHTQTYGVAQDQTDCTVVLSSDNSLQEAIDNAESGDVICLEPGTWDEGLGIDTEITIRGIGEEPSIITDIIGIIVNADLTLVNLSIRPGDSSGSVGIALFRNSPTLTARNIEVIGFGGSSGLGIDAYGGEVRLTDSLITDNNIGLILSEGGTAVLDEVTVRNNQFGSFGFGIVVGEESHLILKNSTIVNHNPDDTFPDSAGILIGADIWRLEYDVPASAEIRNSTIRSNFQGILLGTQADLILQDSVSSDNSAWGLSVAVEQCSPSAFGFDVQEHESSVVFEGENSIIDNNQNGTLEGNPGDHPFQDAPDGQVCLP